MKKFLIGAGVVLVVGLLLIGYSHSSQPTPVTDNTLSGDVRNVGDSAPNGITFGSNETGNGILNNWVGLKMATSSKTNRVSWKNTLGRTVYVDTLDAATDNYASSTFKIYAYATSTAPRTLYDFTAPAQNAIGLCNGSCAQASTTYLFVNGFSIATGTAATTTNSTDKATTVSGHTIAVPANSYVIVDLIQNTTGCNGAAGVCETATSSARGFNVFARFHYHD